MVVKALATILSNPAATEDSKPPRNSATSNSYYQGPATPTAEGQIEIIDSLIAQKVTAIAISANDRDAPSSPSPRKR